MPLPLKMALPATGSPVTLSPAVGGGIVAAGARLRMKETICQVCSVVKFEKPGIWVPRMPLRMLMKISPSALPREKLPVARAGPRSPRPSAPWHATQA